MPGRAERAPRIVGVSLKMYFGLDETRQWVESVAGLARDGHVPPDVDLFVVPDFVSLTTTRDLLRGTGVQHGAQDVCWAPAGPFTGEVAAGVLAEAGCSYAEVGHAERRRLFGEDDRVTAGKAAAAARAGLTPVVCVGEPEADSPQAVKECAAQMAPVLAAVGPDADVVFAYEPVWAIGAPRPAPASYINETVRGLRACVPDRTGPTRFLYGGSAGPGLFAEVADTVDGLFLGRFAHDTDNLKAVLAEVGR